MNPPSARSLSELPTGARAVVRSLRGGRELMSRLTTMGLVAGAPLEVLQNRGRGPLPSHRTGDEAIAMFRAAWGGGFIEGGCGAVIEIP